MTDRADVDDATTDTVGAVQLGFDFDADVDDLDGGDDLDHVAIDELVDGSVDDPEETVQIRVLDADERGMPSSDLDADPIDRVDAEGAIADEADELDAALELDAAIKLASDRPAEWRRVRKWDRPPDPRDWRFFVGSIGRIMLATGVLMFGFVAYQLWGTGIETARAQNSLENRFAAALAERDEPAADTGAADETDATVDADRGDAADDRTTTGSADDDAPNAGADDLPDAQPSGDDGVVIPVIPDLADEAIEQDIPEIERGDALARLEIPKIGQDVYVVPGVNIDDLKDGPGHYPDTPLPGQLGNAAIAGHRTTYGSPFFDVDQLVPGDELRVTMLTGDQYVYEVTGIEIVEATDYWVVSTTNPDTAELTLTSCHPKYSARQRIIVRSVLNPEKSATVGFPTTYELGPADDTPIPGDDPVIEADDPQLVDGGQIDTDRGADTDEPISDTRDDVESDNATDRTRPADGPADGPADEAVGDEPVDDTDREDAAAAGAGSPSDAAGLAAADEFARGWFDDSAAWPQILLWGLALTAIALAAHRISRRFRRDLVGAAVGIVPFIVVLYFFFQNVHRLLPPGI